MKKQLKHYEDIALSDKDVTDLLDNQVKIELYPNLIKYSNLDQLLGKYQACILLFEAKPKYGHWVLIFKLDNKSIEFFNPYGGYPDDSLLYIDRQFRQESNQLFPKLSQLLLDSPYELNYNEFPFQQKKADIKTCGRHCVVRLANREYEIYEYKKILDKFSKKNNLNYDQIVTYITSKI